MKDFYAVNVSSLNTKYVTDKEILHLKSEISTIELDDAIIINNSRYVLNDYDNPISYVNNYIVEKALCINPSYYEKNKEEINNLIIEFIKNYSGKLFIRSSVLINDEVINTIASNCNITEVYLGGRDDIYKLKESDYKKLKNGTINNVVTYGVEKELEHNFDSIINYNISRNLIGYYTYDVLKEMDDSNELHLFNALTDDEVNYFSLLKGATICFKYDDYKNILDSIDKLETINPNFKYKIKIKDKKKFNKELFAKNHISNKIEIDYDLLKLDIGTYLNYEKYLYGLIKPAINLSPYEKFMYAYNIVKHYKKYQEVDENDDKMNSRKLYKIIDNDEYMVCVGYANLLNDLLVKLGIESVCYSVGVDVGFDKADINAENVDDLKSVYGGHERIIVNIVDLKYGIDGIYQSDPTWDNVLGEDSYIYSLMTFDEASKTKRYLYKDKTAYNFLFSKTIKEFYDNVNSFMDYLVRDNTLAIKLDEKRARMRVVNDTLDIIRKIDSDFYNYLMNKYKDIEKSDYNIINNYFQDYLYDIGFYIVKKANKPIKLEQLKTCIEKLYTNYYGLSEDEIKKEVDRTIIFNKERMDRMFPTTYKINQDGIKEVYSSLNNKFDDVDIKSMK